MESFFMTPEQISQESEKLINACMGGDINKVKYLLSKGVDVNKKDQYGDTALSQAALNGHVKIVLALLNTKKLDQYSKDLALIFATQIGYVEIMKLLVTNGADVNAEYFEDYPRPIYQAIIHNQQSAFNYLRTIKSIDLSAPGIEEYNEKISKENEGESTFKCQ